MTHAITFGDLVLSGVGLLALWVLASFICCWGEDNGWWGGGPGVE